VYAVCAIIVEPIFQLGGGDKSSGKSFRRHEFKYSFFAPKGETILSRFRTALVWTINLLLRAPAVVSGQNRRTLFLNNGLNAIDNRANCIQAPG